MLRQLFLIVTFLFCTFYVHAGDTDKLSVEIKPALKLFDGTTKQFTLTLDADIKMGDVPQQGKVIVSRTDDQTFSFSVEHSQFPLIVLRDGNRTILALPGKQVQFVGEGVCNNELAPTGIMDRLLSGDSAVRTYFTVLKKSHSYLAAFALTKMAGLKLGADGAWTANSLGNTQIKFTGDDTLKVDVNNISITAQLTHKPTVAIIPENLAIVKVDRNELEHLIVRGIHRATEVVAPGGNLISPDHDNQKIDNGELRWVGDQRVVLLSGSPHQMGWAHGSLLKNEVRHCVDSALYLAGLASTVATGKWFPEELRNAYARLEKHIPDAHKREANALADASGVSRRETQLANVFPELFHCSGFAIFGKATADGKLYHGRVLDYMTEIGLQDTATVFIMSPDGKIPFANVGYAGFIGSVSGMNAQQISLGEMGGRGEGNWDGVPMTTLMRRALEECKTLDEVKTLWKTSPRTCEYYYVFADGKIPSAVGVAATPEKIEFLQPGQSHELLGPGIADAVVLSAGERLTELKQRVKSGYGTFDIEKATALMCRPVAMRSNLHNVLFVPQDGIFYVANATHYSPAAERPYTKYNLKELLPANSFVNDAKAK